MMQLLSSMMARGCGLPECPYRLALLRVRYANARVIVARRPEEARLVLLQLRVSLDALAVAPGTAGVQRYGNRRMVEVTTPDRYPWAELYLRPGPVADLHANNADHLFTWLSRVWISL
ncbi:MAG: hypothetical protein OXC95_12215 [Dehalococcoidia bacterium]|nr:hypothetical protein [Dehalococcoidia bacterium]